MRGVSRDLPVVKVKTSEGLVARLLMVGIVRIVVVLISESSGAFLQNSQRARAPPALGHTGPPRRAGPLDCRAELITAGPFSFSKHFLI